MKLQHWRQDSEKFCIILVLDIKKNGSVEYGNDIF